MPIKDRYIEAVRKLAARHGRAPGDHVIPRDASLPRCIDYAMKYVVRDGNKPHYRYDRYRDAIRRLRDRHSGAGAGRRKKVVHIDIGCGPGLFSWVVHDCLAEHEPGTAVEQYAYDHAPNMADLARRMWSELGVGTPPTVFHDRRDLSRHVEQADWPANVIVTFGHVLVQIADDREAVAEVSDALVEIRRAVPSECDVFYLAVDATMGDRTETFSRCLEDVLRGLEVEKTLDAPRSLAFGRIEPATESIKYRYIEAVRKLAARHGRAPGDHVIPPDASLPRCIDYAMKHVVGDGSKPHYRYDRYRDAIQRLRDRHSGAGRRKKVVHIDIGCGPGLFSWAVHDCLAEHDPDTAVEQYAYDPASNMADLASSIWSELGVGTPLTVFHDRHDLPRHVEQADWPANVIVTFGHVLVQIADDRKAVADVSDALVEIRRAVPSECDVFYLAVDATTNDRPETFSRCLEGVLRGLEVEKTLDAPQSLAFGRIEPATESIKYRYIEAVRKLAARHGRAPGDHVIPPDASLPRCIDYAMKHVVGDGSKPHYRYDRYRDAIRRLRDRHSGAGRGKRVVHIDIRCGPGLFSWVVHDCLAEHEPGTAVEQYAYDNAPNMADLAKRMWSELGVGTPPTVFHDRRDLSRHVEQADWPANVIVTFGHVLVQIADDREAVADVSDALVEIRRAVPSECDVFYLAVDATMGGRTETFSRCLEGVLRGLEVEKTLDAPQSLAFGRIEPATDHSDVTRILDGLNDRQREAVTAPVGNLLVVAGAGSGKTRVLVHRIAWLAEVERVPPSGVLAVTFTNKAAAEMRGRVEALLGGPARAMWVGTFHAIAHRLLRMHWRDADLPQNFQILDADDQLRLVRRVLRELEIDEQKWPVRQAVGFINTQKDEGRRAKDVPAASEDIYAATYAKVYAAYEQVCRRGALVDFAELLLRSHELWLEHPDLLDHYQHRFRHLLVDEFQDTNAIQYAWLRVLAGRTAKVWAVGDDDQSIYGWRGAKIENILSFQRDFAAVDTVRLEQNYRSTGTILGAANALIGNNTERLGKKLWTAAGDGDPILVYSAYNDLDEARFIAERARAWGAGGGSVSEVAVLYRTTAQSRVIEEALLRLDIPYRIYGGLRFFDRAEIRNALAYMRLTSQRHADVAFERVVNTPPRGIGGKTVDRLRAIARNSGVSLWQAAKEGIAGGLLKGRATTTVGAFLKLVDDMAAATRSAALHDIAEHCIEASGLLAFHTRERGEQGVARKENLEELVRACRQFGQELTLPLGPEGEEAAQTSELDEFLDKAALESGDYQSGGPAVQMMTLHSAKGLEFPLVFMAGMEEGLFPHRMSAEAPGRLEEERRLAYVGMTRAMRQLYFTYAESRLLRGASTRNWPSRFLEEVPSAYLEEVRMGGALTRQLRPRAPIRDNGGHVDGTGLRIGQRVRHAKFGEGVVSQAEGSGERTRVQVHFAAGPKWLMLAYANLEPLDLG